MEGIDVFTHTPAGNNQCFQDFMSGKHLIGLIGDDQASTVEVVMGGWRGPPSSWCCSDSWETEVMEDTRTKMTWNVSGIHPIHLITYSASQSSRVLLWNWPQTSSRQRPLKKHSGISQSRFHSVTSSYSPTDELISDVTLTDLILFCNQRCLKFLCDPDLICSSLVKHGERDESQRLENQTLCCCIHFGEDRGRESEERWRRV